jgi:nicotinate-nucleotide adenylyltransferase
MWQAGRARYVNKTKNTGIFGGTFNPPHIGHLDIAKEARARLNLEKVFFVPAFLPPHKDPKAILDVKHRAAMVKLLIQGDNGLVFSDYELSRKTVSYSIDTIRYFETEFPESKFFFIIGSDAFYYIDTWKESGEVLRLIDFIVYERKGFPKEKVIKKLHPLANMSWIENRYINMSSSDIRVKIRDGVNCVEEVGDRVNKYILENRLYL